MKKKNKRKYPYCEIMEDETPQDLEFLATNEAGRFTLLKDRKTGAIYLVARESSCGEDFIGFRKLEIGTYRPIKAKDL